MSVLRIGLRFSDLATSPSPIASPDICFNKLKLHGVQMTHSLLSVILARIFGVEVFFLASSISMWVLVYLTPQLFLVSSNWFYFFVLKKIFPCMQFQFSSLGVKVSNLISVFPVPLAPVSKGRSPFYICTCQMWELCVIRDIMPINPRLVFIPTEWRVLCLLCVYVNTCGSVHVNTCLQNVRSFSIGQRTTLGASSYTCGFWGSNLAHKP